MVVITQADHEELMENDEVSAEAAGAVRGVARTMQLFVRRAAVGRVPVRRVAKLSDVASNAVDMLSNASETFASSTSNGASKAGNVSGQRTRYFRIEFLSLMRKTGVLAGVLIKNTVFGIAVFETYERIIKYEATKIEPRQLTSRETDVNRSNSSCSEGQSPSSVKIFVNDSYAIAPIRSHFIAGTAAGSVHAVLSYTTDSLAIRSMPTWPFMGRQLLHHSLAHSIMFGTYEWSKRNMLNVFRVEASLEPTPILENEPSVQSVGIAISGAAGGIAGILQNTISHYTSLWLRIDCSENQPSGILTLSTKQTTSTWEKALRLLNQFPPMRQTMVAFPSMAIAFIAFEYGKDFSQAAV